MDKDDMIFLMKIAALERTRHVAGRAVGGAALGAALGAGGAALAGKDWKDGAKAGAVTGGMLGAARGIHNVRRYTHIGKGFAKDNEEDHGSGNKSFRAGRLLEEGMSIVRDDLPRKKRSEQKAKDKKELDYLRRIGKGQSRDVASDMSGHEGPIGWW